ncbi:MULTISPECIES: hypothetical protein [unclassified Sphingopyxis]|uniref:hypothetical protein n=1 Tax=unclassified Sphingopyxis TaxID=2614943 RepID=UPI000A4C6970|nr:MULTISPECIES: hypothetical protein [unclassified Sphingopyxis]
MAASRGVNEMLNQYAAERAPTEAELRAIARAAYEKLLSEICRDQRSTPHHVELNSATNLAFADYYQHLSNNRGHTSLLPAEERRLSEEEGWDPQRVEYLRGGASSPVDGARRSNGSCTHPQLADVEQCTGPSGAIDPDIWRRR